MKKVIRNLSFRRQSKNLDHESADKLEPKRIIVSKNDQDAIPEEVNVQGQNKEEAYKTESKSCILF